MKTFLNDLKNELIKHKVDMEEIADIIKDHQEMIEEAMKEGLSEDQIPTRFGEPKALARELAYQTKKEEKRIEKDGYTLWKNVVPTDDHVKVYINFISEDVIVQPSNDDQIHVYYKGKNHLEDYTFSYTNGELKLEAPKMRGFLFMRSPSDNMSFMLEIPKELTIDEFKQHCVSSDIKYINLDADQFILSTTSGDACVSAALFKMIKMNTVSGDIEINDITANELESSQVSGDLHINRSMITETFHANTVSGDIELTESEAGDTDFSVVSGDVKGVEFYPKTIKFKSVSGDLSIKNKENREMKILKSSSLSGEINIKS